MEHHPLTEEEALTEIIWYLISHEDQQLYSTGALKRPSKALRAEEALRIYEENKPLLREMGIIE